MVVDSAAEGPFDYRVPNRRGLLHGLMVAFLLLGGCTPGSEHAELEPWLELDIPTAPDSQSAPLEALGRQVDGYLYVFDHAADRYLVQCMRAAGFDFKPNQIDGLAFDPEPDADISSHDGYSVLTAAALSAEADDSSSNPEQVAYEAALSAAEQAAYSRAFFGDGTEDYVETPGGMVIGMPANGCLATSREAVLQDDTFAELVRLSSALAELRFARNDMAEAHPYLVASLADWSGCMRSGGFEVGDRDDVLELSFASRQEAGSLSTPTGLELEVASRDITCTAEHADPDDALERTKRAAEEYLLGDNESLLTVWSELRPRLRTAYSAMEFDAEQLTLALGE